MFRLADAKKTPLSIRVPGVAREIRVKIASERAEWRDAFQLVSCNYQAKGYEEPFASKVRFTPFHALPDVITLVAKLENRVLATFSLVPDNTLLGLPLESIYGDEIRALRQSRRRVAEVTSFAADKDLSFREFRQVFVTLIKLGIQYHLSQGGDTWVITVNPRHRDFYTKAMGFVPLGPPRTYSSVQNHPAEGYWGNADQLRESCPKMYKELFQEGVPGEALVAPKMLPHLIRYLGDQSSQSSRKTIREVFDCEKFFASPRRW
jgi:N-acyl amino acid synthase FeeM